VGAGALALTDLCAETSQHALSDTQGRRTARNRADQALEASSRRSFIDGLTEIIENDGEHASMFDGLVDEIVSMPSSDFPLLLTLMRFKYAVRNAR
jgi:hypothetical protein